MGGWIRVQMATMGHSEFWWGEGRWTQLNLEKPRLQPSGKRKNGEVEETRWSWIIYPAWGFHPKIVARI
jgi:hypothetical protein